MASNLIRQDKFCWECCSENTTLNCRTCIRSWHVTCVPMLRRNDFDGKNWRCSICLAAEKIEKQSDLKLLPILFNQIWIDPKYESLKNLYEEIPTMLNDMPIDDVIVYQIDLTKMKEQIPFYTSFNEFYNDIGWIEHNCVILFHALHENTTTVRMLKKAIENEIGAIKECAECYLNACKYPNDWFTMVCSKPHLVVWAKLTGFNYWPGKVTSINGQHINVHFFGDYSCAEVTAKNCYLYSVDSPKPPRNVTPEYKDALNEVNKYIENIRQKFGSVEIPNDSTIFDPTMYGYYIDQFIPGFHSHEAIGEISPMTNQPQRLLFGQKPQLFRNQLGTDKVLSIKLHRLDYSQYEQNKLKRSATSKEGTGTITKKVRFADELGEDLARVIDMDIEDESADGSEHTESSSVGENDATNENDIQQSQLEKAISSITAQLGDQIVSCDEISPPITNKCRFVDEFDVQNDHNYEGNHNGEDNGDLRDGPNLFGDNDDGDREDTTELFGPVDTQSDSNNQAMDAENQSEVQSENSSPPAHQTSPNGDASSQNETEPSESSNHSIFNNDSPSFDIAFEDRIYSEIIRDMKKMQDNILNLVRLSKLRKMNNTDLELENSTLRAENTKLIKQLATRTVERDQAVFKMLQQQNVTTNPIPRDDEVEQRPVS